MTYRAVYLTGPEKVEVRVCPLPRPGPGEILLRVGAATTCGTDVKVFRRGGHPRMLRVPGPFGHEVAGTVAEVGGAVERFRPGDRVVVANSAPCGRCRACRQGRENLCEDLEYLNGAFAEVLLVPARFVASSTYLLEEHVPLAAAATAEPLACVLHGIGICRLEVPADVVVLGGGPIGLLFAAVLVRQGHRVVLADPSPARLRVARELGVTETLEVPRGGGQADRLRRCALDGRGFAVAIDASGLPEVWLDAIGSVRPGGLVNLFGGCAPGTTIPLDTHLVHYGEIAIQGCYHHRPATVARAVEMLSRGEIDPTPLLSGERPIEEVEEALRAMMAKRALKVVIRP